MFRHFFHQIHFFSVFFRRVQTFLLKVSYCVYIVVQISEAYSEPCQMSWVEFFAKIVNDLKPLTISAKTSSQIFDRVLNTPLDGWILYSGFFKKISNILNLQIGYNNGDLFLFSKLLFMKIFFIKIVFRFTFSRSLLII